MWARCGTWAGRGKGEGVLVGELETMDIGVSEVRRGPGASPGVGVMTWPLEVLFCNYNFTKLCKLDGSSARPCTNPWTGKITLDLSRSLQRLQSL